MREEDGSETHEYNSQIKFPSNFNHKEERKLSSFVNGVVENLNKFEQGFLPNVDYTFKDIQSCFLRNMDQNSVFRLIYRLSIIGLVADCQANYKSMELKVTFCRLSPGEYIIKLKTYLSRYETPEMVERMTSLQVPVKELSLKDELDFCLDILLGFVYDHIAKKRKKQMENMANIVRAASRMSMETTLQDGGQFFAREMYNYFQAKYIEELQRKVIGTELERHGLDYNQVVEWVGKMRHDPEDTSPYYDKVSHLRGSCRRLLDDYSEHGTLQLLFAYTLLVSREFDRMEGLRSMLSGLLSFQTQESTGRAVAYGHNFIEQVLTDIPDAVDKDQLRSQMVRQLERLLIEKKLEYGYRILTTAARVNQKLWGEAL